MRCYYLSGGLHLGLPVPKGQMKLVDGVGVYGRGPGVFLGRGPGCHHVEIKLNWCQPADVFDRRINCLDDVFNINVVNGALVEVSERQSTRGALVQINTDAGPRKNVRAIIGHTGPVEELGRGCYLSVLWKRERIAPEVLFSLGVGGLVVFRDGYSTRILLNDGSTDTVVVNRNVLVDLDRPVVHNPDWVFDPSAMTDRQRSDKITLVSYIIDKIRGVNAPIRSLQWKLQWQLDELLRGSK